MKNGSGTKRFLPNHWKRFNILMVFNLCNISLAIYGIYNPKREFSNHLLKILLSNLMLYIIFYITLKLHCKEKILVQTYVYMALYIAIGISAAYFFNQKTTSWNNKTPAFSRTYNKGCSILPFYDYHDIWHLLSAITMFFWFMLLLTLDDPLIRTHRSQIPVF